MKKTKIILYAIMFLITLAGATAFDWLNQLNVYHSFDNSTITLNNISDLTGQGRNANKSTQNVNAAGIILEGINKTSSVEGAINLSTVDINLSSQNWSVNFWINPSAITANSEGVVYLGQGQRVQIYLNDTGTAGFYCYGGVTFGVYSGSAWTSVCDTGLNSSRGTWRMYTFIHLENGSYYAYMNTTLLGSNYTAVMSGNGDSRGQIRGGPSVMDEYGLWNRTLSIGEITELYNGGLGLNYNGSTSTNFTIYAFDSINSSSILVFNATLSNSTITAFFNTTTGFINTNFSNGPIFNITINSSNHQTANYTDYNTSTQLIAYLNRTNVNISFFGYLKIFNDSQGVKYNITLNGTLNEIHSNVAVDNLSLTIPNGVYNITFSGNSVLGFCRFENQSIITDTNYACYFGNATLNVSVIGTNGSSISNVTISFTDDLTGYSESNDTLNSYQNFTIISGRNYTITAIKNGYSSQTVQYLLENVSNNVTITLSLFNTFYIYVYNFSGLALMTSNVTSTVLNNASSFQSSTTSGFFTFSLLVPGDYELRFTSPNFNPTSEFLTLVNDTSQNLSVYMTANASSEIQVVQVLDTSNQPVEAAVVWLQREAINQSSQFYTVSEGSTDSDGKTAFYVDRATNIYYRFAVIYEGVARQIQPSGNYYTSKTSFIPGVSETIQLVIDLSESDILNTSLANVACDLSFESDNLTLVYQWVDSAASVTSAYLLVQGRYIGNFSWETISNDSIAASSGSLNYTLIEINDTEYLVSGYVVTESQTALCSQTAKIFSLGTLPDRNFGLIMGAIIIMIVALLTVSRFPLWVSAAVAIGAPITLIVVKLLIIPIAAITAFIAVAIIFLIDIWRPK